MKLKKIMLNFECNKYKLFDFIELILKILFFLIYSFLLLIGVCLYLGYFLEWFLCLLVMWLIIDVYLVCFSLLLFLFDEVV